MEKLPICWGLGARDRTRKQAWRVVSGCFICALAALAKEGAAQEPTEPPPPAPSSEGGLGNFHFTLGGSYWRPDLRGDIFITKGGQTGSGTRVSLNEELGLDEANAGQLDLAATYRDHRLRVSYLFVEFEGRDTLSKPFVFHDHQFLPGDDVHTQLGLQLFEAVYDYRIIDAKYGELRIGAGMCFWMFDSVLRGSNESGSFKEHRGFSSILPIGSLSGRLRYGDAHADVGVSGGYLQEDLSILEIEGSVGYTLWGHLDLFAGYRFIHFEFHETSNQGDMGMRGPIFGLTWTF
ncbi:MAG TPA: hypothetical protein VFD71_16700 [Planctomycetota bacterium]|nr:hypothetical protein [Planctomycetota bacterium]